VSDFIQHRLNFIHKNDKFVFEPPFGDLVVTYALLFYMNNYDVGTEALPTPIITLPLLLLLWLVGKPLVDLLILFVKIKLFC